MTAITFALPDESRAFTARLRHAGSEGGFLLGNLGASEIALFHTGMGAARVRERLPAFLRAGRFRCLVAAGYAGGLDATLRAGEAVLGYNLSDPALLDRARKTLGCRSVRFASAAEPLETPEAKTAFFRQTAAAAVDLETETIAALCREHGLPMLALRVISDTATETLPVPFHVCFDAATERPRIGSLLGFLARRPRRIPAFLQFVRRIRQARATLADALERLVTGEEERG